MAKKQKNTRYIIQIIGAVLGRRVKWVVFFGEQLIIWLKIDPSQMELN